MGRKRLQTRADADTADAVEDYADDHDLTQSEDVRRMIRAGLTQHGYEIATADGMGTVADIEQVRSEISKIEQRQIEIAEQREQRIKRTWAWAAVVGMAFVIVTLTGTHPPLLVIGGGMIMLAAVALATYNAATLTEDNDE